MIYLASRSPQRSALLEKAAIAFRIIEIQGDEDAIRLAHPQALATERARFKALHAAVSPLLAQWRSTDVVLGVDTLVSLADHVFGKPRDRAEARDFLIALSGTTHTVTTAHCCHLPAIAGSASVQAIGVSLAQVTMRPLGRQEIETYVDSGEGDGKAGAYAIQEQGDRFIVDCQGDRDTVVGLHVATVRRLYQECTGIPLPTGERSTP